MASELFRHRSRHPPRTTPHSGAPVTVAAAPAHTPEQVWKRLTPLIAAPGRSRMRLWSPGTEKFSDTTKRTDRLPTRPAAVYLYTRRRTTLLALDFDAKRHGPAAVETDIATATAWITECGGVVVTDRSSSGGAHLLCPLAIGTTASHDEMVPLVRLLAARLPTLDITPNTNAETGCITPPGSPCREGGYRMLTGSLHQAVDAFTTRSAPDLLPRLSMLLGAVKTPPRDQHNQTPPTTVGDYLEGHGDDQRLRPEYLRTDPLPVEVADYAASGTIAPTRPTWQSNHEARMSVVTHALARGHSLNTLRTMIAPDGPWHHGLGAAYQRYHHRADQALSRDVAKAFHWLATNALKSSPPRHKRKYSPGGQQGPRGPLALRLWLANAIAWADREFAGKRYRWTVQAVLQSLAFHALLNGEQRAGTWLVGAGGRTLSLASGLLSEDTIWRVLADLREREGSPILLARRHMGIEADVYALTSQNRITQDPTQAERCRIEAVHDAWNVLGHHLRRVYELVAHHGLTRRADLYAAARIAPATGDAMVTELQIVGLLTKTGRGTIGLGPTTLNAIADRHHLHDTRQARLARHREERAAWRAWLLEREHQRDEMLVVAETPAATGTPTDHPAQDSDEHRAWLDSVMATGPPDDPYSAESHAIEMVADLLGGRIIAA